MTTRIRVIVAHAYYGCDTGCCGHVVKIAGTDEEVGRFEFEQPDGDDFLDWAIGLAQNQVEREYGPGHVADLDWEHSFVVDD